MKTTLDIPDLIFRQSKAKAALRGVSLRQFVTEALEDKVSMPTTSRIPALDPPWMKGFGALADLHGETIAIDTRIQEAFGTLEEEDKA
jgi:hypothetical protein